MTGLYDPISEPPFPAQNAPAKIPAQNTGRIDGVPGHESPAYPLHHIHAASFPARHVLFATGNLRDHAYLIDRGEVVLQDASGVTLCRLGPGEIFGEMALIEGGNRTATAITATEAEIFIIPRNVLQERVQGLDPVLSLLIGLLVERYRATRVLMPESIRQDAPSLDEKADALRGNGALPDWTGISNVRGQSDAALKELKLDKELRRGLERAEFIPVLQPILRMPDRQLVGFEALIRWYHPQQGLLYPDHFIPVAERTGVVQLLDRMMVEKACRLIPEFLSEIPDLPNDFFISVNLSGINFETLDVVQAVRDATAATGVHPRHLKLEITESALITDPARAAEILQGLRALGVTIALDDFGTGYSSLGYLHQFPLDSLKIDRSFVRRIHDSPKSLEIVSAIIALARNFKLGVIVEGIETEADAAVIDRLGCDMAQGYLFGKPMSSDDAKVLAKRGRIRI